MPAYTSVSARQTLQQHVPQTQTSPDMVPVSWTPAVREYVQRAFEVDNAVRGITPSQLQEKLKSVITRAALDKTLQLIDWTQYPLPQELIMNERDLVAINSTQQKLINGINHTGLASLPMRSSSPASIHVPMPSTKKRKSLDADMDHSERVITPPWKKNNARTDGASLGDRVTQPSKKEKKQKKQDSLRAGFDLSKSDVEKRKQRFGNHTPDISSRDDSPMPDANAGPVAGTSQTLEKHYFRLTAAPNPSDIRPLPILERALELVRTKWIADSDYAYACDQLKSIRQDLTVQHIKNVFTVRVYEVHARIALEKRDMGEYNQCQTQLRALYKQNLGGKVEEFTAYRILYFIYTRNRTDMNNVLADLTKQDKQQNSVKHALAVRSALASGNYHRFFKLYQSTPDMGAYLLDMIIERERLAALAVVSKAYKPDVSMHFLAKELAFQGPDSDGSDVAIRDCVEFICSHGVKNPLERKADDVRFLAGMSGVKFDSAKSTTFRAVDIKGQI